MSASLDAFSDELSSLAKTAGIGKVLMNNKLKALGAGFILVPAAMAAKSGYKSGRAAGKPSRYLAASRHGPSRSFWTNWSGMLSHKKLRPDQLRRLHENYHPGAMRR